MSKRGELTLLPSDLTPPPRGQAELVFDHEHTQRVVRERILRAEVSLDLATADFKAMLVPASPRDRDAPSIIEHFVRLAQRGVEVRVLHAGVPSVAALRELKKRLPAAARHRLTLRRCPRLHAKAVVVDAQWLYLGSANLTGAGLGAKGPTRRNFEWGVTTTTPALIDAVLSRFNQLWEGQHCLTCGRRDVCPVPLEEPNL
ncbi:MAG: phospholipase D family protein [Planctomycetota bacterium]